MQGHQRATTACKVCGLELEAETEKDLLEVVAAHVTISGCNIDSGS